MLVLSLLAPSGLLAAGVRRASWRCAVVGSRSGAPPPNLPLAFAARVEKASHESAVSGEN